MMKSITIKLTILIFGVIIVIFSCDLGYCEKFDLRRIPNSINYYKKVLYYTNKIDTFALFGKVTDISKESNLNSMGNPECDPNLDIKYSSNTNKINGFSYYFSYKPTNNYLNLKIYINDVSKEIFINKKYLKKMKKKQKIDFQINKDNYYDSLKQIKSFVLQDLRIKEIEFVSGDYWHLIKIE